MTDIYQPQNERERETLRLNQAIINSEYCQRIINQKSRFLPLLKEIQIYNVQLLNISDAYIDLETWIFRSDYDWYTTYELLNKFFFYWTQNEDQIRTTAGDAALNIERLTTSDEYDYYRVTVKY
jgi:hypothetical protein